MLDAPLYRLVFASAHAISWWPIFIASLYLVARATVAATLALPLMALAMATMLLAVGSPLLSSDPATGSAPSRPAGQ